MSDEMVSWQTPILIKALLDELGLEVQKHRQGPYNWEIRQGSALIDLAYHSKSGLIIGEARLCKIPPLDRSPLYKYLLLQNDQLEGLSFSIKEDEVILSLLIYDKQINIQQGIRLLRSLLEKSDHYDDILVEDYGGSWLDLND